MSGGVPLPHAKVILPLLSFGTGAADAFAFTALGGIFTANMTGNAVLATIFTKGDYKAVLAGALVAMVSFATALYVGFRVTRRPEIAAVPDGPTLAALAMSAGCLLLVCLLWWFAPHTHGQALVAIAASSFAMALQTVAAKKDGVPHGPTTTYLTGTLTDIMEDIAEGSIPWWNVRWLPLVTLPLGAVLAVCTCLTYPDVTPLLPLAATTIAMALIAGPMRRQVPGRA